MKEEKPIRVGSDLEKRTLKFAVDGFRFAEFLPNTAAARVVTSQMLCSATAVGANYREANRAESKADFVHKVALSLKEAAEAEYWLELCAATKLGDGDAAIVLRRETNELIAILTTIQHKAAR